MSCQVLGKLNSKVRVNKGSSAGHDLWHSDQVTVDVIPHKATSVPSSSGLPILPRGISFASSLNASSSASPSEAQFQGWLLSRSLVQ